MGKIFAYRVTSRRQAESRLDRAIPAGENGREDRRRVKKRVEDRRERGVKRVENRLAVSREGLRRSLSFKRFVSTVKIRAACLRPPPRGLRAPLFSRNPRDETRRGERAVVATGVSTTVLKRDGDACRRDSYEREKERKRKGEKNAAGGGERRG